MLSSAAIQLTGVSSGCPASRAARVCRCNAPIRARVSTVADPETGASLAYAFTGRRVLRPYIGATVTDAEQLLLEHLRAGPEQPGVCPAIQSTGITHVLDFGRQNVHSRWVETPGLDHLDESPAVRLVERHGAAALYEVVACR